jgi:PAS domain S-box-containing protein
MSQQSEAEPAGASRVSALPRAARITATLAGAFTILSGVIVLAGWVFNLPGLTDWTGEGISMFPNAAAGAALAGVAMLVLAQGKAPWRRRAARAVGAIVAAIGGLTLVEHLLAWDLGLDTLLVERDWGQYAAAAPMRIGMPASISLMLLGTALTLSTYGRRARRIAFALALGTTAITLLSLTGYAFGVEQLFSIERYTGIALLTSTIIAVLSIGVMALLPEIGIVAALRRDDAGGAMLRGMIVPTLALPLVMGWLRLRGQEAGLYGTEFGTALRTLAEIVLLFALIWWTAGNISRHAAAAWKAQSRLAAIVDSSADAIVSKSLDGIIESWNAGATQVFGYTPAEALGRHISLIIPPERAEEEVHIIQRISRGERIEHFETVRQRKDGSRFQVSITISPVRDADGAIIGAAKIARDVTDRKRVEEQLRAVVDATPECVKIVAPDGSLEFMNCAGLDMFESESLSAMKGACIYDLVAPEHRNDWIERHRRICAGERMSWEFEIIGLRGMRRWMETYSVPMTLADGRSGHLAVARETTEQRRFASEREELLASERSARSEAERASQLKDEFLATLSHELRTPLNAILGWAQLLNMSSTPDDLEEGLDAIERNARAQAQLIEDLLDMSRIISGKVRLDMQSTDLAAVVDGAVASVTPAAEAKKIRLRKIVNPHTGLVSADPGRLQQVVWNLLSNAIKFTPHNGTVDVVLERVGSHVQISVRDTGIGIAPEFLSAVFERFRQVDSSAARRHGGLGLGLSIVKQLVELHGGTVDARSDGEGHGATFTASLPIVAVRGVDDEHEDRPAAAADGRDFDHADIDLAGLRVLVVDDEADARALVQRVLSQRGAEVGVASSAIDGLEQLRKFRPHVLVSDIGMPDMDGYQFIREVRRLVPDEGGVTPAIALTAFARSEDRMRSMIAGYQMHMTKPIEPQELVVAVGTFGERRQQ